MAIDNLRRPVSEAISMYKDQVATPPTQGGGATDTVLTERVEDLERAINTLIGAGGGGIKWQ